VFGLFASVVEGKEKFMTPQDFMRAITPFVTNDGKPVDVPAAFTRVMAVADPDGDGRISFAEYVFFTSLLSIPTKSFDVVFRIMDRNQDNQVDAQEFKTIMNVIQSQNPMQQAARVPVADGVLLKV
jgi:Ca2+-binding EF-hand superfamily protein